MAVRQTAKIEHKEPANLRKSAKASHCQGFALIEILISILILGTSLVTLLSLQSSSVQRAIRDRNEQNAMLVARSIMSAIEIDPSQLEPQDITIPASQMINDLLPSSNLVEDTELKQSLERYQAQLLVEEKIVPLPTGQVVPLQKVYLKVFWGEGPAEKLESVFFVNPE